MKGKKSAYLTSIYIQFMQKLLYLLLLISVTACGQASNERINQEIKNSKTPKHINIPGTRLYIVPPPGFKVARMYCRLEQGDKSMFNIYDIVGGNFYTNGEGFSKQGFEQKGAKVLDYRELKVNGYPAKYVSMQSGRYRTGSCSKRTL
ncbi:hypothetical protein ACTHGU_08575 [Chitinophagaceae bacterium MMS25-I14]